jgi:ABC-type transporter Mla maintaining outer membrane lipid asymmetry ATPase subunit MlaF
MLRAPSEPSPESDPSSALPLFALRGVRPEHGGRTIPDDLTLELPRAALTGIVGPSGAGKTALFAAAQSARRTERRNDRV